MLSAVYNAQAAARAAESDRLLAKSVAERAVLQARYMALGARLGAVVRGNDATAYHMRQVHPPGTRLSDEGSMIPVVPVTLL